MPAPTMVYFQTPFMGATYLGGSTLTVSCTALTRRTDWFRVPTSLFIELYDPATQEVLGRLHSGRGGGLSEQISVGFRIGRLALPVVPGAPRRLALRLKTKFQPLSGQPVPIDAPEIQIEVVPPGWTAGTWRPPMGPSNTATFPLVEVPPPPPSVPGPPLPLPPRLAFVAEGSTLSRPLDNYLECFLIDTRGFYIVDSQLATSWNVETASGGSRFQVDLRTPDASLLANAPVPHRVFPYTRRTLDGVLTGGGIPGGQFLVG